MLILYLAAKKWKSPCIIQADHWYMAVCFWYHVKRNLSRVRCSSSVHWSRCFLQGTRNTRPCSAGRVVQKQLHGGTTRKQNGTYRGYAMTHALNMVFRDEDNILDQMQIVWIYFVLILPQEHISICNSLCMYIFTVYFFCIKCCLQPWMPCERCPRRHHRTMWSDLIASYCMKNEDCMTLHKFCTNFAKYSHLHFASNTV